MTTQVNHISECPFCNSNVTNLAFAERDNFLAIYNHAPIVPGHSLIIPSSHIVDLFELSIEDYNNLFLFARDVISFLCSFFETKEFDLSLQQGVNAGQSVAHLHLHLIPRKEKDINDGAEWYQKLNEEKYKTLDSKLILPDKELQEISLKLRQSWSNLIK